ncbi:hypothetical protein [Profundibacter sp.]|uniref:hypothetical protein n=1 Tax=Profundibacter sp. TaxID=3101071 RepID=UPI003D11BF0F
MTRLGIGIAVLFLFMSIPIAMIRHPNGLYSIGPATLLAKSGPGSDGDGGGDGGHSGHGGGHDDDGDGDDNEGNNNDDNKNTNEGNGPRTGITKIELSQTGVEVRYADGSSEEIKKGRYIRRSATGKTVVSRRATGADFARLRARANGISIDSIRRPRNSSETGVNGATVSGKNIRLTYTNGWSEEISSGQYTLRDQYNRTVG